MTYDTDFDAPPPSDADAPSFRTGLPAPSDYVLKLANAIDRLAAVLERQSSPGAPQTPAQSPPPGTPTGPPAGAPGGNETQIKRGKAIYAKCKNQVPPVDIKAIGEHVTGHEMHWNSQQWSEADQVAVLDSMKAWGWS